MRGERPWRRFPRRVCFCGGPKESGFSFCGVCYHMLPRPMQHALWRKAGHGYEQAYADAKARVEQERRRPL